ncbi:M23 family metallopeptidase [Alicyclobacillus tolerans]|uniref:Peptidase family M23 n=1 Tax=Alicyclobacillus tolerans TaxID=90970 RepID=A0A1M6XHQ0_9BACL|nr:M23 family metallopeptidase [Alicyclobacillus montanus]SHL05466.1 Peptidase family M23 [Alicyclobacillus montanus]
MLKSSNSFFKDRLNRLISKKNKTEDFYEENPFAISPHENSNVESSSPSQLPKRWVDESLSPYGFADDHGGLQQMDSPTWRKVSRGFGKQNRFIPKSVSSNLSLKKKDARGLNHPLFIWKILGSLALVLAGIYSLQMHNTTSNRLHLGYQWAMSNDETSKVMPFLDKLAQQLRIQLPSFGVQAAEKLHDPVSGVLVADYSNAHPEIWIQTVPGAVVDAAGSGNVVAISKDGKDELVEINNGSFGYSLYAGLANVTVKIHQYVYAGQIIGHMPANSSQPVLRFSMFKNGQFENPHQWIKF